MNKKKEMKMNFIYRNRRRIATLSLWGFLCGSLLTGSEGITAGTALSRAMAGTTANTTASTMADTMADTTATYATAGTTAGITDETVPATTTDAAVTPSTRPFIDNGTEIGDGDGSDDGSAATGSAVSGPSAFVTHEYNKKVSYSKIRKKLKSKRTYTFLFEDTSKTSSKLTLFGFFYKTWNIPHTGYGDMNETITLYPVIKASKNGSSSNLSFGIRLESYIQILNPTKRKYKKMILSGGGEKITLSGSTTTRMKIVGQFVKRKYMTTGTFTLSSNKNAHELRIQKLKRILAASNTKITVKDTAKKKTYKCKISAKKSIDLTDFLKRYMNVLKKYRSK